MDPLDHGVHRDHEVLARGRPQHCRVVADADPDPFAGGERAGEALDELELAGGRHGHYPAAAVGEARTASAAGPDAITGSERVKVVPAPGVEATFTVPAWASR